MINNEIDRNAFINNVECNINHTNSLKHLLNNTEDEYDIIPLSTYTDVNTLAERMSANNSTLSVLSLNAQSINAKFDELKITIDQLNEIHTVSVICIQESWLDCNANIDLYRLNNYNLISKGKYVSEHGGLLIYLHVDFEYDILEDIIGHTTGWEQLFLKIRHKNPNSKKYIIGNVYRVPNEIVGSCNCFTDEFSNLLTHLQILRHPTYVSGDFNLNLLQINNKKHYKDFFEKLISCGFYPKISMPTRFTEHSATLIDNIFTNQLVDHESGILSNSISDHQMIFSYSKDKKIYKRQSKYIEVEVNNENALNALLIELQNLNLFEQISSNTSADPNTNFENFMNVLSQAKQKCMPKKIVKFDKKKHKQSPWMTNGILNSINSKNKMYRNFYKLT